MPDAVIGALSAGYINAESFDICAISVARSWPSLHVA